MSVADAPGMLRVKLLDSQTSSGSGNNFPTVLVVAEHAERAAAVRAGLAVALRELDAVCAEANKLETKRRALVEECQRLAHKCERSDAALDMAIKGDLRRLP